MSFLFVFVSVFVFVFAFVITMEHFEAKVLVVGDTGEHWVVVICQGSRGVVSQSEAEATCVFFLSHVKITQLIRPRAFRWVVTQQWW